MSYSAEEQQWINFYDKMAEGKIPYSPQFYQIDDYSQSDPQEGSAESNITLVSPTEAQVNQAKMQLKRKIALTPRPVKRRRISKVKKGKRKVKRYTKTKKAKKTVRKRSAKTTARKKKVKRKSSKRW